MQNRYTGDLGDFGKFGLLRRLCQADEYGDSLRLGVIWYLVPDESGALDGKHVNYLEESNRNHRLFESCDPGLWKELKAIVDSGKRDIIQIQQGRILPEKTVCYDQPLYWAPDMKANSPNGRKQRLEHRREWWQRAFKLTSGCDLVFFDPDNGLNNKVKRHSSKGPKFVFMDEVAPFFKRGQSLVIYQHLDRSMKAESQALRRLQQIKEVTGCNRPFALLYRRGTSRFFLIVPVEMHNQLLNRRCVEMCKGNWGKHFANITGF